MSTCGENPVPHGQRVLFHRRWLSKEGGELPSDVQAATWLDIKRVYMELRPELRRLYTAVRDIATYAPIVATLGFVALPEAVQLDEATYHSALLDFGPSSVDGWLAKLAANELLIESESILDPVQRQLVLDGRRVDLTRLEFDLLDYLYQRQPNLVERTALLRDVWGYTHVGSNVVDTVVRSLRTKLGERASMIETVRGAATDCGFDRDRPPFHSPNRLPTSALKPMNGSVEQWARLGSNQRPPACER